jgi:hypothetical protein
VADVEGMRRNRINRIFKEVLVIRMLDGDHVFRPVWIDGVVARYRPGVLLGLCTPETKETAH